jgi:hypothetical protein
MAEEDYEEVEVSERDLAKMASDELIDMVSMNGYDLSEVIAAGFFVVAERKDREKFRKTKRRAKTV